ncbi:hypothetical protein [Dishui Lake large algae virus 1]|nr:hypothetical protein [Dishui Lake large algae virus 1]
MNSSKAPVQQVTAAPVEDAASTDGVLSKIKGIFTSKPFIVVAGLITTVIVGLVVAWIVYMFIKKKVVEKTSFVVKETHNPVPGSSITIGNGTGIPNSANGKRFSFSFWIYIHNLDKNAGLRRHVIHRGDEKNSMGGSPSVFLDPTSNKLHMFFDTTSVNDDPANLASQSADIQFAYRVARRGITVDYVPLQRWVHIAFVINETANGGSISAYVDGELTKSVSSNSTPVKVANSDNYKSVTPNISNLALDRKGNIYIGGDVTSSIGVGFSGLVSMVEFFNYDLNSGDVYKIYTNGPIYMSSIGKAASTVGLGSVINQYGVRNPIYKRTIEDQV